MAKKVKGYTVKRVIGGEEYVFQNNGVLAALRATDESYVDGTSNTSLEKLADYIFEHVIVSPKGLTPDSFDSVASYTKVFKVAMGVMNGSITPDDVADEKAEK